MPIIFFFLQYVPLLHTGVLVENVWTFECPTVMPTIIYSNFTVRVVEIHLSLCPCPVFVKRSNIYLSVSLRAYHTFFSPIRTLTNIRKLLKLHMSKLCINFETIIFSLHTVFF